MGLVGLMEDFYFVIFMVFYQEYVLNFLFLKDYFYFIDGEIVLES